jgi:hypothetical protein
VFTARYALSLYIRMRFKECGLDLPTSGWGSAASSCEHRKVIS